MNNQEVKDRLTALSRALDVVAYQLMLDGVQTGEFEDMTPRLRAIEGKIIAGVATCEKGPTQFELPFKLVKWLSPADLDCLGMLEQDAGGEGANAWLVATLLQTGKYADAGNGEIAPL